ncbi:MAG: hypothetical protein K5905_26890 [Roseibium sp.]|uniref:hypothetical protein n=1 Tax=Roseibium sp. TaxID=1936156 RepID=UPI00261AE8D1|nr:hypothetical protein [Roseibium sp.]MCV0429096.1 hypothetical protein [Roseibium sp.]
MALQEPHQGRQHGASQPYYTRDGEIDAVDGTMVIFQFTAPLAPALVAFPRPRIWGGKVNDGCPEDYVFATERHSGGNASIFPRHGDVNSNFSHRSPERLAHKVSRFACLRYPVFALARGAGMERIRLILCGWLVVVTAMRNVITCIIPD